MNLIFFFWPIFACKSKVFRNNKPAQIYTVEIDNNQQKQCVVCLEELFEDKKITPCNHSFHLHCILEWLNSKENCPLCRTKLKMDKANFNIVLNVAHARRNALNVPQPRYLAARQVLSRFSQSILNIVNHLGLFNFFGYIFTLIAVFIMQITVDFDECNYIIGGIFQATMWSMGLYIFGLLVIIYNICETCEISDAIAGAFTVSGWIILAIVVGVMMYCKV